MIRKVGTVFRKDHAQQINQRAADSTKLNQTRHRRVASGATRCYRAGMNAASPIELPSDLISELEARFFWWEPVAGAPRSPIRILAQAMNLASFAEVRRLEKRLGAPLLSAAMLAAEPGWLNDRSWEFWRGRLSFLTGHAIPEEPPRRAFDAGVV